MKNSTNNMDDLFKQHFEQTTTIVADKEGLWAAIGRERSSKKGLLIWFLAVGFVVSGLGAYLAVQYVHTNDRVPYAPIQKEYTPKTNPLKVSEPIAVVEQSNSFLDNKSNTSLLNVSDKKSKKELVQHSILKEKTTRAAVASIEMEKQSIFLSDNKKLDKVVQTIPIQKQPITNNIQTEIKEVLNTNLLAKSTLQTISYQKEEQDLEMDELDMEETNRKWDKCYVKAPGKLFLDGYGQASIPIEKIYQQSNSDEIDAYQALWEDRITPFMSYQAGVQIGYQFPWKGYISGGLSYQHFETKYENMQTVTERITIFDEMAYFYIDDAGETVWVADSVTVTNVYERQQTLANQHQLWHIPIQLGYVSEFNNWRLGVNVEALINISKTYQGRFIKLDNTVIDVDRTEAKDYVSNNIGVSLSAGIHVGYMLDEHWEWYANPRFRLNNASFLNSNQALDIQYQFGGIRAGLKYWF